MYGSCVSKVMNYTYDWENADFSDNEDKRSDVITMDGNALRGTLKK